MYRLPTDTQKASVTQLAMVLRKFVREHAHRNDLEYVSEVVDELEARALDKQGEGK